MRWMTRTIWCLLFGVAIAAVMLLAGELYLVTRPDPPEIYKQPPSVVTSSMER
jgi:hypothetical protein